MLLEGRGADGSRPPSSAPAPGDVPDPSRRRGAEDPSDIAARHHVPPQGPLDDAVEQGRDQVHRDQARPDADDRHGVAAEPTERPLADDEDRLDRLQMHQVGRVRHDADAHEARVGAGAEERALPGRHRVEENGHQHNARDEFDPRIAHPGLERHEHREGEPAEGRGDPRRGETRPGRPAAAPDRLHHEAEPEERQEGEQAVGQPLDPRPERQQGDGAADPEHEGSRAPEPGPGPQPLEQQEQERCEDVEMHLDFQRPARRKQAREGVVEDLVDVEDAGDQALEERFRLHVVEVRPRRLPCRERQQQAGEAQDQRVGRNDPDRTAGVEGRETGPIVPRHAPEAAGDEVAADREEQVDAGGRGRDARDQRPEDGAVDLIGQVEPVEALDQVSAHHDEQGHPAEAGDLGFVTRTDVIRIDRHRRLAEWCQDPRQPSTPLQTAVGSVYAGNFRANTD